MPGIMVAGGAGFCCLIAAFLLHKRPTLLFGFLLTTILVGPLTSLDFGGKSIPLLLVDLFLPAWLLVAACFPSQCKMPKQLRRAVFALAAFVVVSAITTVLIAPDFMKALWTLKDYGEGLVALYLVGSTFRTWRSLRIAATCLYLFGGAMAIELIAVSSAPVGGNLWANLAETKNLAHTAFGQSNYIAGFFVLALPIAVSSVRRSALHALFAGAAIILMILGLVVTASRGAILAIVVTALAAVIRRPKRLLIGLAIALGCGAIALSMVPDVFVSALQQRFLTLNTDPDTLERVAVWSASWAIFIAHPLLGLGLKASGFEFLSSAGIQYHTDAHNFILTLLCETGIVGTCLYLAAMVACFRGGISALPRCSSRSDRLLLAGLLVGMSASTLHALVEILHGAAEYSIVGWSILGMLACATGISSTPPDPEIMLQAPIDAEPAGAAKIPVAELQPS